MFVLGAGADFVMMGGMFAGHDQSGKDCVDLRQYAYVIIE